MRGGLRVVLAIAVVAVPAACRPAVADTGVRAVEITIHYSHFDPSELEFTPGTTVRFVVNNTDPIDHEFILGDAKVQEVHELGTEAHHPPLPGEMSIPAGTTRTTTHTFTQPGSLIFGCHLPGHYGFGMRGSVTVA